MEQFPTDTVDYADIVLPATMQTEHLDVNDGYGHSYIHLNRQAVEPPGECLSTLETFRRLARAMDLDEPALYESDEEVARTLLGDERVRVPVRARLAALPARALRALHRGLPDAVGQARVLLRSGRPTTGWTRSRAGRRRR